MRTLCRTAEEGFETSSFAEDVSQTNQPKIDLGTTGEGSVGKQSKIPQLYQKSVQDENYKLSDTGLKELSIVESDGSAHDLVETPATTLARNKKKAAFRDYHQQLITTSKFFTDHTAFSSFWCYFNLIFYYLVEQQKKEDSMDSTPTNLRARQSQGQIKVHDITDDHSQKDNPAPHATFDPQI